MTIQQQIEQLKKEFEIKIAELEKQAKAEEQKQSKVWKPKKGEDYWVMFDGEIDTDIWEYDGDDGYDNRRYIRGNIFKTKEEAEWADQHRIVATELKRFVQENDPRPITEEDWENEAVAKYYIIYDNVADVVRIYTTGYYLVANQVYASNMESLYKAIEAIGEDRLKKYYFGVKE